MPKIPAMPSRSAVQSFAIASVVTALGVTLLGAAFKMATDQHHTTPQWKADMRVACANRLAAPAGKITLEKSGAGYVARPGETVNITGEALDVCVLKEAGHAQNVKYSFAGIFGVFGGGLVWRTVGVPLWRRFRRREEKPAAPTVA